jgi:AcrR family transcriptional regulator
MVVATSEISAGRDVPAPSDGRHQRSERTRAAIVDALFSLLEEGDVQPSAERIADRAGVSRRSIFHHFRDVEDLLVTAADKQIARVLPTLRPVSAKGPLDARVAELASQMCGLYARIAPMRRAALLVARSSPSITERLRQGRAMHTASVERVFRTELAGLSSREEVVAALVAASSFSVWEELVTHQGLSPAVAERVIRRSLAALLVASP